MGSPEATLAAAEAVGTPEVAFEELTGSLQGWKRKQSMKKGGTLKKKDVIYVAPDGLEIKTKRQLEKYLKAHSGTLSGSDFEWGVPAADAVTSTENRRRSARLSLKGRSSTEGLEESSPNPPVVKRSRKSRENGKDESDVAASKGGADIPADNSQFKEEGNGEGKRTTKAMDVDVCKLEVRSLEENRDLTTTLINKDEEKLVFGGINGEKHAEIPTTIEHIIEIKVEDTPLGTDDAVKLNEEADFSPPHGLHALVGEIPESQEVGCIPASAIVV